MKTQTFKNLILLLNECSLETGDLQQIKHAVLTKEDVPFPVKEADLNQTLEFLDQMHLVKTDADCFNLFPCCIIYAKSSHHTQLEALALFEMGIRRYQESFQKNNLRLSEFHNFYVQLIKDSILLDGDHIATQHRTYCHSIRMQYQTSIVSETLSVLYTDYIIDRTGFIEYKNTDKEMVNFDHKQWILEIMPDRGIPVNRDVSKNLQIFYKDTLMHEFNKACPICGAHLSKILIASHIKPFRDCAHLYEAACHDNGLLLCRNHDILFDQGYISFDDEGKVLVHEEIAHEKDLYRIKDLDPVYMSEQRKLFLDYHRKHIFKK
ncbi:MAG: HNH endonuclease [Erysipelotrichaceae bacterium]|nr:HNH endonuclease [Erysipelotrichaceae bacterium]